MTDQKTDPRHGAGARCVNAIEKSKAEALELTKKALQDLFAGANEHGEIQVLVDNPVTAMAVKSFLEKQGLSVLIEDNDGTMTLAAHKKTEQEKQQEHKPEHKNNTAAPIAQNTIAQRPKLEEGYISAPVVPAQRHVSETTVQQLEHDQPLAPSQKTNIVRKSVLIRGSTLGTEDLELGKVLMLNFLGALVQFKPSTIILMNGGVKLAVYESSACDYLKELESLGVKILVSGTCCAHFGITEKVGVGAIVNMYEIIEALAHSESVWNL